VSTAEAQALAAKLFAAFPSPPVDPLTFKVYVERLESFPNYEQALECVNDLIGSETFRPPVALLVEGYYRYLERHRARQAQLEWPDPTPEERAANLAMAREWAWESKLKGLTDSMEMPAP
jgi:hypothetical protein